MSQPVICVGRRKEASARVWLATAKDGNGTITVNGKPYQSYFPHQLYQSVVEEALAVVGVRDKYHVSVNVRGGGIKGQAEAIRLGIARALIKEQPEWKPVLRAAKLLTRDARAVERKKSGRKKARKRFQFSKR